MSGVRVLVGTHKGAFVLTSDGKRKNWDVSGPHFGGLEIYHMKGSPVDPNRIYASQTSDWFGQVVHRSDDGGKNWQTVGNEFAYATKPGQHTWYDGTPHPWEFKRVWHFEPSLDDPDKVYAGVEDAALFHSSDGGQSWQELPGLRNHTTGEKWAPGAGGLCLHTILIDPSDPARMYVAISAAGVFRTKDAGQTWEPINKGLRSNYMPDEDAEVGHCVHRIAMHPVRRKCFSCRNTGTSCAAMTGEIRGMRSAATCPAISASSSAFIRTSRRRRLSSPSRAIRSTTRRKASCACIARGRAARSGKR